MMAKLIEPELSYKLIGICFKVHSELGPNNKEKIYQKAIEIELKENKIPYKREIKFNIDYKNNKIGSYFFDFLIDNRIILELKANSEISNQVIGQLLRYLRKS